MVSNLLPTYISGGVALFIAVGGIVAQILRDGKLRRQQQERDLRQLEWTQQETTERLLKQKAEEYYLISEKALHGFTKIIADLGNKDTKSYQDFLDGQLENGRTLAMLENYYLMFFKNARHGAIKLLFPLLDKVHHHVEQIRKWEASPPQVGAVLDVDGQWRELWREFDVVSKKLRKFLECLSRMDLYRLYSNFKDKKR
jgi:hypothetical protein